jgi:hypothetical protein
MNDAEHHGLVAESDLFFCGVDVDVDLARRQLDIKDDHSKSLGHEKALIGLLHNIGDVSACDGTSVHREELKAAILARESRRGDKSSDGNDMATRFDFKQVIGGLHAEQRHDAIAPGLRRRDIEKRLPLVGDHEANVGADERLARYHVEDVLKLARGALEKF